jgi:hypothetical protein
MKSAVESKCERHGNRWDCPDALINYLATFDEYGIMVHDGGSASVSIDFCPWCGARLPESQRARWFEELEVLGIKDPFAEAIPEFYTDGRWRIQQAKQGMGGNGDSAGG